MKHDSSPARVSTGFFVPAHPAALAGAVFASCWIVLATNPATAAVERQKFVAGGQSLTVEILDDDLAHFELTLAAPGSPAAPAAIPTSDMVSKTDYAGPAWFSQTATVLETAALRIEVNPVTLAVTAFDKTHTPPVKLATLAPQNLQASHATLSISQESFTHAYGLGEQFVEAGSSEGDWIGRARTPGGPSGNAMVSWDGGAVGNCQFPVVYFLGQGSTAYAMFLDDFHRQQWSMTSPPWTVDADTGALRWYVMTGPDLADLRRDYLELVGRPLVPPKKAFGLWVSEYGYDDWAELESKLQTLRQNHFPIDGFVLDLQWFGGVTPGSDHSRMGALTWDTAHFPNPAAKLAQLRDTEGLGIIVIEESYVAKARPEHAQLAQLGYLVRQQAGGPPVYLTANPWWGKGGMIDWTNEAGADFWHDQKRQALIDAGVFGHWTDLGEPEMFDASAWYDGLAPFDTHAHADVHNLYNLAWHESIARGYTRHAVQRRPFILSRSGAPGIQRLGAGMWSGDIGGNLTSLASHANAQMHLSMSGVDFFGADIGGFHRSALGGGDLNEMFTQWFANGAAFDVPVRPHTENLANNRQTAPDRIGNVASNLENIRRRYELIPYYYSLAHRAHLAGEPLVPPLVFQYPDDPNVREMGHEKLIGRDLLVAIVARHGEAKRGVYLPAGTWIDWRTREFIASNRRWLRDVPLWVGGRFGLPIYARAGAIVPKMHVDDKTMNALGKRTDGSTRDELVVRVFAAAPPSQFTLYEDDGETIAYLGGAVRTTALHQQLGAGSAVVTIDAAAGTYAGAPAQRRNVVELVVDRLAATAVTLNGAALPARTSAADFEAAPSGWFNAGDNLVLARSDTLPVGVAKTFGFSLAPATSQTASVRFVVRNGTTVPGESVYVVGNISELGNWDPLGAVKLDPLNYPTWEGVVAGLSAATAVEWKAVKCQEAGGFVNQWEPGANNTFTTPAAGQTATAQGDFAAP